MKIIVSSIAHYAHYFNLPVKRRPFILLSMSSGCNSIESTSLVRLSTWDYDDPRRTHL